MNLEGCDELLLKRGLESRQAAGAEIDAFHHEVLDVQVNALPAHLMAPHCIR